MWASQQDTEDNTMLVVDAQVHAWRHGQSTGHHRREAIDLAVLEREMAAAGVDRAVLVPPLWDPHGNAYSLELAAAQPHRFAVMGLVDAGRPDAATRLLRWRDQPGMKGVRLLLNTPERLEPWRQGLYEPLLPLLEQQRMPTALLVPGRLDIAHDVATRFPDLPLIVDHLGVPRGAVGEAAFKQLPELLRLAALANVHVKAAGVGDYALDPFPFRSLQRPLREVFDAFGAQRVLWASELSRLHHSYAQCVEHMRERLPFLDADQVAAVMGGNVLALLDWQ